MRISINASLFAHIELDSELSGRYGVQGNTFSNTFGYLNQYFKTLSNVPPHVIRLAKAMDALVTRQSYINSISASFPFNTSLNQYTLKTSREIEALQVGETLLIPGGYQNDPVGHAMIYQFEKTPDGDLLFSIFNSGAGIDQHEKTTSTEKELFSPVKTYKITHPIDSKAVQHLIKKFTIPMLAPVHSARRKRTFDPEMLYNDIEIGLEFLNALLVPLDLSSSHATTGSQLSGTCAQRSIHQMLKMNFDALPEYQRFIFDFKMYALKDFIATHPAPPRGTHMTALIQKAIANNLKILAEPGVFNDEAAQDKAVIELERLQQQIHNPKSAIIPSFLNWSIHFDSVFRTKQKIPQQRLVSPITPFNITVNLEPDRSQPLQQILRQDHLLDDIAELIRHCKIQQASNPVWVMNQIEQAILQLPIPTSSTSSTPCFDRIPFYNTITTASDFDRIGHYIDQLHHLYEASSSKLLNNATVPTQVVTYCSLLALRDYIDVTGAAVTGYANMHDYFYSELATYLNSFRTPAFLATNHPLLDQRMNDLKALTHGSTYGYWSHEKYVLNILEDYQALLDSEPALKSRLESMYDSQWHSHNKLNQSLRDYHLTALYVLLNEFDNQGQLKIGSALATANFMPLVKKIQHRFALERVFVTYLDPLKSQKKAYIDVKGPYCIYRRHLSDSNEERKIRHAEDFMYSIFDKHVHGEYALAPHEEKCVTQHKYNLTASSARLALLESHVYRYDLYNMFGLDASITHRKNSNQIQLLLHDTKAARLIIKDDYFTRDLFHLRASPTHQINLTLDYFEQSDVINKLADRNLQQYVEANLFEPGLLLSALDHDHTFTNRFHAFIEKGLHYFTGVDGLPSHESLFFMQLRMKVHRYMAFYHPESVALQWLKTDLDDINTFIAQHTDSAILTRLHTLRFLTVMALHQLKPDPDNLVDALFSYVYLQAKPNLDQPEDTASQMEQQRAGLYFKEWLRESEPAIIQTHITPIMLSIGLDVTHLTLTGTFPRFHYNDEAGTTVYTFNADLGRVFQDGQSLGAIPLNIKNHPIMRQLGLEKAQSCWISEDKQMLVFKSSNIRMKQEDATLVIQKKWSINGIDNWYQLKPLTKKQQHLFGLESTKIAPNTLPPILTDGSIEAWVSETDTLIVQNKTPIYQVDQDGVFHQLDSERRPNGRVLSAPPVAFAKSLSQFEDPGFFRVNLDHETKTQGFVDFARYGLSLNISHQAVTIPNTDYVLMPPESSLFGSNVAALQFSNGIDQQCIIAVQPFYVEDKTPQTIGEYYQFTHDTTGRVPSRSFNEKNSPICYHHKSQQTITYKVVNGMLKPNTAASGLYLCYLYLATHETDKAWAVLDDINRRLSLNGSIEELTYLSWIVNALPVIFFDEEKHESRKFETPEYIACQLKALALYTDFLTLNSPPVFNNGQLFNSFNAIESTEDFYKSLPNTIYNLYSRHQRGKRHLDEKHLLLDAECKSLLDFCDPNQSDDHEDAQGAIGYERRRLSLKSLLKEHMQLIAIRDTSSSFPPDLAKRLDQIEKHITDERRVMKKSTKLEWKPKDLTLYAERKIDDTFLSATEKVELSKWEYNVFEPVLDINTALSKLSADMEIDDLLHYFPTYFHIARLGTLEETTALKQFCVRYLAAFRPGSKFMSDQEKNIPYLVNILYRVLENPDTFKREQRDTLNLSSLTKRAAGCDITPIIAPQAKDVFEELLATERAIWEELKHKMPAREPMPTLPSAFPEPLITILNMSATMRAYREEEDRYTAALSTLFQNSTDPSFDNEQRAGQFKYDCIKTQRHIAATVLQSTSVRDTLHSNALAIEIEQQASLVEIWQQATNQANTSPENPKQARDLLIQLIAEQRHKLTKKDLLILYLQADLTQYVEKTGLSKENCFKLHEAIHTCVSLEVQHQQIVRLLNSLDGASTTNPPQDSHLHQIADILMSQNIHEAQTDPALMCFQYAENILVRPRQAEALTSLLFAPDDPHHVNNVVEKVIMGGGKSKVILPLLAAKKATGLKFVVVEVPRALLATNHADLNSTSQRLFGQKAHRFEFNRDSDSTSSRLKAIYQRFHEIMTNKEYIVTTGETMQSLELKYMDLLLNRPENQTDLKEWRKQVYWAGKITGLIKQCGDVVIDEIHQGLLLKKKLNYTLGDPSAISPALINHSIALYQFVDALNGEPFTIDELLSHPKSPLINDIIALQKAHPGSLVPSDLKAYFQNQSLPICVEHADPGLKDALAFYKQQLILLPQTQARHYKEHYGPSNIQDSALKRALAIPYIASNQPNERSRFGNTLETMNYTVQSLLNEGLNEMLLRDAIARWQIDARNELIAPFSPYRVITETPTAIRVNKFLADTGATLQSINLHVDAQEQFRTLFESIKYNRQIIYAILEEQILTQITKEPTILHSDAFNHVDMYRTAQGLSGTPWNHSTYHQNIQFDSRTSLGTDGYVQTVLKQKPTLVSRVPFTNIDLFLLALFKDQPNARAIIDISATFAGISNLNVARKLAAYACVNDSNVQFILYFNENDVLCALSVNTQQSIELATSDPSIIDQKLGCTPDERITYYDQSHTVGTDLKQAPTAHAFVLADSRTHLQAFLQGCMRMRGLENQQTVTIIVPDDTPDSYDDLIALMSKNEQTQLKEDNFYAALAKMDNIVRQDFLQRIAAVPDEAIDEKYNLAQAFKHYFIETKQQTLFEQYGGVYAEQLTDILLKQHHTRLMKDWEQCLVSAKISQAHIEMTRMDASLRAIVEQSVPLCKEKSMGLANQSEALGTEVEYERETLKEAEKEKLNEALCFDPKLEPKKRHDWKGIDEISLLSSFSTKGTTPHMHSLNSALQTQIIFSDQLFVDDNYAQVYEGQERILCPYLKPVMGILFRKCGESITACLIDMEDLAELTGLIKAEGDTNVWISDTRHTLLEGVFPENIMQNSEYQALIEQIRFFNGECNELREQKAPLCWLNDGTSEKLAFFQEHIMPYRKTTASEFNNLQATLSPDITMAPPDVEAIDSIPRIGGLALSFFNKKPIGIDSETHHVSPKKGFDDF